MRLATLAIQAEAWLQEELGAERALLELLRRAESAARTGSGTELECCRGDFDGWLGANGARESRRTALLEKFGVALAVPTRAVTLTKLVERLRTAHIDTQRLDGLRAELREVATTVARTSRHLAAMAHYHRGLLEELCQSICAESGRPDGHLVDARG